MWILYLSSFGCRWKISYVCVMQMWALWMLISKSPRSWLAENRTTGWQDCQGSGICERKAEWSRRKWAREIWSESRAVAGEAAVCESRSKPDIQEERAASKTGGNKEKQGFSWLYKRQDGAKKTILCYTLHKLYSLYCLPHPQNIPMFTWFVSWGTAPYFWLWHHQGQGSCHLLLKMPTGDKRSGSVLHWTDWLEHWIVWTLICITCKVEEQRLKTLFHLFLFYLNF